MIRSLELQSQVESLRKRVEELEEVNARLSGCRCREKGFLDERHLRKCGRMRGEIIKADDKKTRKAKDGSMRDLMHCPKRYVTLRVTYFGQRIYGFASEAQQEPTLESELFKALEKTRLSFGDKRQAHYSRFRRTDKGVSSIGQARMSLVLTAIGAASGDMALVAEKKMYVVPWLEKCSRALSMKL